ncbi:MAG: DUF2298 domain-containing protein [Candidatus Sumerlaeaceae bacterium]|nr:DUF2298 domain-containing protein [Candidatus Sumerlaeaceae bacterium]
METMWWYLKAVLETLPWYGALQLWGIVAWPFFFGVFNRLPDRGYAASKAVGLLIVAYATYLLSHGAGQGFQWTTVAIASGFLAFISLIRLLRTYEYLAEFVRLRWQVCLTYELVFLAAFIAMVLFRAQVPQITYEISDFAAEKFTDFAVLNSLLSSPVFPPHDAWVSGFTLNYYYFGHFLWATVARFCSIGSEIAFNLGLASIFAYTLLLAFSLGYNLTAKLRWGLFSAFFIGLSSNIDGGLQILGVLREVLDGEVAPARWYMAYDFWRSSRAIENTINEFPAFSFILGDLHAHVSSLVVFLLGLLLGLQVWRSVRHAGSLLRYEWQNLDELLLLGLIFGALYAANSWDVVTFAAYVVGVFWSAAVCRQSGWTQRSLKGWPLFMLSCAVLAESILLTAIVAIVGITVLFRPYWVEFSPPNARLLRLPVELSSAPLEFAAHWFLLLMLPLVTTGVLIRRIYAHTGFGVVGESLSREKLHGWLVAGAAVFTLVIVSGCGVVAGGCATALVYLSYVLFSCDLASGIRFLLTMLGLFAGLAGFSELYYFDDIFTGAIERINTVFKIYYGLWPIAVIASVMAGSRLCRYVNNPQGRRRVRMLLVLICTLGAIYPIAGTLQRIGMSKHYPRPKDPAKALDGMRYLGFIQPDDYAAILWIRAFTPPETRIVEAPGKQYEYAGRISTNTGRQSLGGWLYHEWGWRGPDFEIERDERLKAAELIYTSRSLSETAKALLKGKFSYVVVGDVERERYPLLIEDKFSKLGAEVYRRGRTVIYALSQPLLQSWAQGAEEISESEKLLAGENQTTETEHAPSLALAESIETPLTSSQTMVLPRETSAPLSSYSETTSPIQGGESCSLPEITPDPTTQPGPSADTLGAKSASEQQKLTPLAPSDTVNSSSEAMPDTMTVDAEGTLAANMVSENFGLISSKTSEAQTTLSLSINEDKPQTSGSVLSE